MDSARTVPVEPAGSDSGFRVVDVQQRVKAAKLPKKQDPLDHVDSPDKSSSSSSEDDTDDEEEEPILTNNTQIHINTGSTAAKAENSKKEISDPGAKKPENKKQFIRVKLNNKWNKDRWEITDKVPNAGDGIRHAASGNDIKVVRRVELKADAVGKNSMPKSPELVNKAPEFGPVMKPSTISLITILDGFAKVKEIVENDGPKSKSPAGERESEKTISKVESPVKDLEQALKDESIRRDAPHPSAVTDFGQLKPKPDKKIFDQTWRPGRVENEAGEPSSNDTVCKITEFFDYGKKIMMNMIEEESKSKDELINELINELNLLKEANGHALSLMTPDQREKYDKEQSKRTRTRRVLREDLPKPRQEPKHNARVNGHPPIAAKAVNPPKIVESHQPAHQTKTKQQQNSKNTPMNTPNGNQNQVHRFNGLPSELPPTGTHHLQDPNQQFNPVLPGNYVRNNLGQYQYIHPHHTVPVSRRNPAQGQPNSHYHQQSNGLQPTYAGVNYANMSSSPHLWNGSTK